ncbi:hypothetical protein ACGRPC_06055 [Vibrio diabolicus]|uniref:hypothetical protein n=1 Tax=Vibrio diabolicus TaxID=50719 RepID=UPI0037496272
MSKYQITCKQCKKRFRTNYKQTKTCKPCKEAPKIFTKKCTTCGTEFTASDGRRTKCTKCRENEFFNSTDFARLYKAFQRNPYLEQFPDDTEGLLDLLNYLRQLKLWRGYHTVEVTDDDTEASDDDTEANRRYAVRFHNLLDNSHLHPAAGTAKAPHLKGRLVTSNLIALPQSINRKLGNRHTYPVKDVTYDSRECQQWIAGINCNSLRTVLVNHFKRIYDITVVRDSLSKLVEATDDKHFDKYVDYKITAPRVDLLTIARSELQRLSEAAQGSLKQTVTKLLETSEKSLEEFLEYQAALNSNDFNDFENYQDLPYKDYHQHSEELAAPLFQGIANELVENYRWC